MEKFATFLIDNFKKNSILAKENNCFVIELSLSKSSTWSNQKINIIIPINYTELDFEFECIKKELKRISEDNKIIGYIFSVLMSDIDFSKVDSLKKMEYLASYYYIYISDKIALTIELYKSVDLQYINYVHKTGLEVLRNAVSYREELVECDEASSCGRCKSWGICFAHDNGEYRTITEYSDINIVLVDSLAIINPTNYNNVYKTDGVISLQEFIDLYERFYSGKWSISGGG